MDSLMARVFDVLPHYLVMLALVFAALWVVETYVIDNVVVFFVVVMAIVIAYRPVVTYLGYEPQSWRADEERR